jgi:PIN domain nuclease of toxin-antitoxin system
MLIDTHVLIWMLDDKAGRLGPQTQKSVKALPLTVSVASLIEIAVKKRKGKLDAPETNRILTNLVSKNTDILDVRAQHIANIPRLEISAHADPFDLVLMAQAISEGLPLLTCDSEILKINFPGLRLIDGRK